MIATLRRCRLPHSCAIAATPRVARLDERATRGVAATGRLRHTCESLERRVLLAAVDVLTYRNFFDSTGQNLGETTLTPAVVANAAQFGKRFTTTLDGQVYAQPLVKTAVNVTRGPSQGVHNVLYAAT